MKKSLRSLCAVTTISLCAMGNLFAVDNNYFNSVYMIDQNKVWFRSGTKYSHKVIKCIT